MTDSGLSSRLRQQSRRAGLMVGISMALAMLILILGAAGLFAWLSQPFSDLIPVAAPASEVTPPVGDETQPVVATVATEPTEVAETPITAGEPTQPATDDTAFDPTHQISAAQSVNFRAGPSRADAIVETLPPQTPLRYLDEDEPTTSTEDGDRWMKFATEGGSEGWVREIDTEPYQP